MKLSSVSYDAFKVCSTKHFEKKSEKYHMSNILRRSIINSCILIYLSTYITLIIKYNYDRHCSWRIDQCKNTGSYVVKYPGYRIASTVMHLLTSFCLF